MPWKALSFDKRELKETLSQVYEVSGIPTLILLGNDGSMITDNGRGAVSLGADYFPWGPKEIEAGRAAAKKAAMEAKEAALKKEAAVAAQQKAANKVVFRRLRGVPGTSKHDPDTNKITFEAFDTFAAETGASSGKLFYEITAANVDRGIAQAGWADLSAFDGCASRTGEGVGDDKHSWGFDGNRCQKWGNAGAKGFGKSWTSGDVLGCAIDLDAKKVLFGLNGSWDKPMGIAFEGDEVSFKGPVAPAVTAQGDNYSLQMNFGASPFKYGPPDASFKAFKDVCQSASGVSDTKGGE